MNIASIELLDADPLTSASSQVTAGLNHQVELEFADRFLPEVLAGLIGAQLSRYRGCTVPGVVPVFVSKRVRAQLRTLA